MTLSRFSRSFRDAEAHGFLPVPMPVPPMLEEAFGYRGRRRFVALAYGVEGGVMGDVVTDATKGGKEHHREQQALRHLDWPP
jgi:hypothetical protein